MITTSWASGIPWTYTIWSPRLFNVQGEFIYLFLMLIFVQTWFMLKLILILLAVAMLASFLGYSLTGLARRWNRWRLGTSRAIYCTNDNKVRFLTGI